MQKTTDSEELFDQQRRRMFGIAYRMLGNISDAEDVVQDAWLRWSERAQTSIENPPAYLTRIATTLSIDTLRRRRRQQADYPGPWLPDPLASAAEENGHESTLALAETLSVALLVMLEQLGPNERAAFVLREAFDLSFDEIGDCLNASPATCRQWRKRARDRLRGFDWREDRAQMERDVLEKFLHALGNGDTAALVALLETKITLISDGGGKVAAATRPLCGVRAVSRFLLGLAARRGAGVTAELRALNGGCGVVLSHHGQVESALTLNVHDGLIRAIFIQRNPDKLATLNALPVAAAGRRHE